jgi:spore germination protein YaaH
VPGGNWRRYVAPLAFLAAVTIAVGVVRAGLKSGDGPAGSSGPAATTISGPVAKRYWRVRAGDTFASIARKSHVSVKTIERLNPKVRSTSLFVGERIRTR